MAIFNKNTLRQVSGFDNQIIAGELVYNQATYWNLTLTQTSTDLPIDLTGATINASIIRRQLSNVHDSRYGLTFDIADYTVSVPSAVNLTITNRVNASGQFTLVIDDNAWGFIATDTQLDINAESPVGFSGRIKISYPASGTTPAQDLIVFLLFLVRSDGVIN
jgi:hypothetical protein